MRLLVGIPVYAVPWLTRVCLDSLINTPADILVIDNKCNDDVKETIEDFKSRVEKLKVIEMSYNTYCNGGWNEIMRYGIEHEYDIIALGSSDVELHKGWYDSIMRRFQEHSGEILFPVIGEPSIAAPGVEEIKTATPGFFTFFPLEAIKQVYPIPSEIKHWFGDEYMFGILRKNGWKFLKMLDVTAYHQWSAITLQNPDARWVIEDDKKAWKKLNL